jgi:16S rRNA U516 pseudouridylate synthase RsuA-like enzyme
VWHLRKVWAQNGRLLFEKGKCKRESKDDRTGKKPVKKQKREEMNQGEEEESSDEHIMFVLNKPLEITFDDSEEGQYFNFNQPDVNNSSESNPCLLYYD